MNQVRLRAAEPREACDLTALAHRSKGYWGYDQASLDRVRELLTMCSDQIRDQRVIVAERDGVILELLSMGGEPPDAELMDLFIEPDAIGTGLGRRLWEHAVKSARERGFRSLQLESDPHAEPFYVRMGARRIGEREVAPERVAAAVDHVAGTRTRTPPLRPGLARDRGTR